MVYVSENISRFVYTADVFMSNRIMFRDIVHPDDTEKTKKEIQDYVSKNIESYKQIYRIVTRDGEAKWTDDLFKRRNFEFESELMSGSGASVQVFIHGNTIYSDTGTIIGNMAFVVDMTRFLVPGVSKPQILVYPRSRPPSSS
jgi:hypothetical protein